MQSKVAFSCFDKASINHKAEYPHEVPTSRALVNLFSIILDFNNSPVSSPICQYLSNGSWDNISLNFTKSDFI